MNKPASKEKKDKKANAIVQVATDLFLKDGIEEVKMTDIADKCLLGVATLYRYFRVKKTIVISSGILVWQKKLVDFEKIYQENKDKKGIDCLEKLLYHFLTMYEEEKEFFIFLRQFDTFCLQNDVSQKELEPYDYVLTQIKDIFVRTISKGAEDKTIRTDIDYLLTYYSFSKALIGLCQKLISEGDILTSDIKTDSHKEVETLLKVLMDYFRG